MFPFTTWRMAASLSARLAAVGRWRCLGDSCLILGGNLVPLRRGACLQVRQCSSSITTHCKGQYLSLSSRRYTHNQIRCSICTPTPLRNSPGGGAGSLASCTTSTAAASTTVGDTLLLSNNSVQLISIAVADDLKTFGGDGETQLGQTQKTEIEPLRKALRCAENGTLQQLSRQGRLYLALSKSRLSLWVALSSLPAYQMVCTSFSPEVAGWLFVGTLLASCSANSLNQIYERKRDAQMSRTKNRPMASNRLSLRQGCTFAVVCGVSGVTALLFGTNGLTGCLGGVNIIAYAALYTPLKVVTPLNTSIGAIIGSIPVLMGCTAAECSLATAAPWMLFLVQTLWQFPHFYSLAWMHRLDYLKAGYVMYPLTDEYGKATARMMLPYLVSLSLLPMVCAMLDFTSLMFMVDCTVPNAFILWKWKMFLDSPSKQSSRSFFLHSLWHLFAIFGLMALHRKSAKPTHVDPSEVGGCGLEFDPPTVVEDVSDTTSGSLLHQQHRLQIFLSGFCMHNLFEKMEGLCLFNRGAQFALPANFRSGPLKEDVKNYDTEPLPE